MLSEDFNQYGVDAPSSRVSLTLTQAGQGFVQGDGSTASFNIVNGQPFASSSAFIVGSAAAVPAGTGFNIGDANRNNLLDPGENWQYQAARTVTAGQYGNVARVNGNGVGTGTPVTDDDPSHHFGRLPASLGNFVWNDVNRNGIQDAAEANKGVNGVVVTLYGDEDGNGSLEQLRTQLTRDDPTSSLPGYYQFTNLVPGVSYQVGFSTPAGFTFTSPNVGGNDSIDSDAIPATGRSPVVTLAPGENNATVDAGLLAPLTVDLTKYVRVDAVDCPTGPIGGIDLGNLTKYLFVFTNGSGDANWQGATKGFAGDVVVNGIAAAERTSGGVPYAGTIYTNDSTLGAWQGIVDQNAGQAHAATGADRARLDADRPAQRRLRADQRAGGDTRLHQRLGDVAERAEHDRRRRQDLRDQRHVGTERLVADQHHRRCRRRLRAALGHRRQRRQRLPGPGQVPERRRDRPERRADAGQLHQRRRRHQLVGRRHRPRRRLSAGAAPGQRPGCAGQRRAATSAAAASSPATG